MSSVAEHRPLMMRANRTLGSSLVEHNLLTLEQLEQANERLLEVAGSSDHAVSILGILVWEKKFLQEQDLFNLVIEDYGLGVIDLTDYEVPDDTKKKIDPGVCWASWSVPFDQEEDFTFIATAYYLSPAVRSYWEKQVEGNILWYATSLEIVSQFLEKLQAERLQAAKAGVKG